jgi:hypothetical protein
MKKILFSLVVISSLVACQSKTENTASAVPTDAFGYTLNNSENINTAKKAIDAGVASDSAIFVSIYTDSAVIYDNMNKQTIFDNLKMAKMLRAAGITMKLEKMNDIWETVSFKADSAREFTDYVNVYFDASFTKGDKKAIVRVNAVFGFKDGKIAKEWDTYDSAPLAELLK